MKRRLVRAWLLISVCWILYSAVHALSYWWRWGDFISPENRFSVWLITVVEVLAAPILGGIALYALFGLVRAVQSVGTRIFRAKHATPHLSSSITTTDS